MTTHDATLPRPFSRGDGPALTRDGGRSPRTENGFTMVEVLVATLVLTIGILGLIGAFDGARKLTFLSERRTSLAHRAQKEVEKLLAVPYVELAMTSTPAHSTETTNPYYYVNASKYRWDPENPSTESLVTATSTPAECESTPQTGCGVVSGERVPWTDGRLSGYIYDFVTWHTDGHCGALCPSENDYKRVTVVVTLTVPAGSRTVAPVRLSAFIPDPAA